MKEYINKQKLLEELRKDLKNDCNIYHSHINKEIRDEKYEFAKRCRSRRCKRSCSW